MDTKAKLNLKDIQAVKTTRNSINLKSQNLYRISATNTPKLVNSLQS